MDLVAIERGDEGRMQLRQGVVRDAVRRALDLVDGVGMTRGLLRCIGQRPDQAGEFPAPLDDQFRMRVEQIEILALPRVCSQ
jgi:hypothetical protein